jgi:Mg-chelatase subunit ChlD
MRLNALKSDHLEEAPMHWGARFVSLNEDRTGIADNWSSELVLDTRDGRTVGDKGGDPTIWTDLDAPRDAADRTPQYETSRGQVIPEGIMPGTKLIEDEGLSSAIQFNVGSYVVAVDEASGSIANAKRLAAASTAVIDMYTNDTNCLV